MFKNSLLSALCLLICGMLMAQTSNGPKENWFNLDYDNDKVRGVGIEKAYKTILKGKNSTPVIVAVIDSGVEVDHEDLKDVMWVNPGEIPGNKIDDDNNGYIDDIHGWNFLGGADGRNVSDETLEVTRLYAKYRKMYDGKDRASLSKKQKKEYDNYIIYKTEVENNLQKANDNLARVGKRKTDLLAGIMAVEKALGNNEFSAENIKALAFDDEVGKTGQNVAINILTQDPTLNSASKMTESINEQFDGALDYFSNQKHYMYNPDFDSRDIVGDNYNDPYDRDYGNNDYEGPDAFHGTHVSGIIAATRNNDIGMNGVADNVRIMTIRAVPDGDERDKDVANSIRYAVDNGAQVINMSFGKGYSWNKKIVDEAVKYARKHDVLLVHASGNSAADIDAVNNYPNDKYAKSGWFRKKNADNWLEIGALSWKDEEDMIATFSNYAKGSVDIFSPGVDINSTIPDQGYGKASGTSMASPVTAGVAAVLRSYFPTLTARQVRDIIMASSTRKNIMVKKPGSDELVPMSSLSVTGGILNAYEAVKLASRTKGKKKISKTYNP